MNDLLVRDHLDRARLVPTLRFGDSGGVIFASHSLESGRHDVAFGRGLIDSFAVLVDLGVKRFVSGLNTHAVFVNVLANRPSLWPVQVRTQQSERGNLSAQNPLKEKMKVRKILQRYIEGYIKGYTKSKGVV